jgi:hypothetical protein
MQGIERNPKLGYYQVGEHRFYSKPEALIYATETNQTPEWVFNSIVYAKLNWLLEPEVDIRELYRLRAVQLRDKYDYIRLELSGGGDSTTAAFAFLLNGIHLDEVVFRYPKTGEKDFTNDPFNTKPNNTLSEFQFAAQPLLNWIKTNCPDTLVTMHDYSENMLEQDGTKDESWIFTTRDWFQPGHADKFTHFGTAEHCALADSGKHICALIGIDKPKLTILDDKWYAYFNDVQANSANPIVKDYTNITSEYFFWTPDMPEIVLKQAHMIMAWFEMPQNHHLKQLVAWPNFDTAKRTAYEHIAKSIIYPDYDLETWQTSKPTNSFYNEMDAWFYTNFQDTQLFQAWEAGLQLLVNKIDKKFILHQLDKPVGLHPNTSPLYYIGDSVANAQKPALSNTVKSYFPNYKLSIVKDKKLTKINTQATE